MVSNEVWRRRCEQRKQELEQQHQQKRQRIRALVEEFQYAVRSATHYGSAGNWGAVSEKKEKLLKEVGAG